ncbi:MAG: hypothetical protein MZW92_68260 [Comamonadaceae bacterium]|nr:hypothetical protein [Comamonadaceae bacterium]
MRAKNRVRARRIPAQRSNASAATSVGARRATLVASATAEQRHGAAAGPRGRMPSAAIDLIAWQGQPVLALARRSRCVPERAIAACDGTLDAMLHGRSRRPRVLSGARQGRTERGRRGPARARASSSSSITIPRDDVFDEETGGPVLLPCPPQRTGEHGHFHTFLRARRHACRQSASRVSAGDRGLARTGTDALVAPHRASRWTPMASRSACSRRTGG